jgi:hypothetical protein
MEQVSFPIKTKIAAWWMIITSILVIIGIKQNWDIGILFVIILCLIQIFFSLFMLKRKKWAWWGFIITSFIPLLLASLALLLLFLAIVFLKIFYNRFDCFWGTGPIEFNFCSAFFFILIPTIILIVPFILLLLDRKNFWKIAKQS